MLTMNAQYVTWAIMPGVYDNIEYCADGLYTVTRGGKVGVIDHNSKTIVPIEADRITDFYNGLALVLQSYGTEERVMGILNTSGEYIQMSRDCNALSGLEFFSEELLPVKFHTGHLGYVDTRGNVVKEFDNSVTILLPFSEGYAVVGKRIVNRNFEPVRRQFTAGTEILNVFSVYHGKAMLYTKNGSSRAFIEIDVNNSQEKPKIIKIDTRKYDYLGCLNSGRPSTVPYDQKYYSVKTSKQNDKYGSEELGIPYQFDEAIVMCGKQAIVKFDGRYAVLATHDGSFVVNPANQGRINYRKSNSKRLSHQFALTKPEGVAGNLQVTVRRDGTNYPARLSHGQYEFAADASPGRKSYTVEVVDNGLIMWEGLLSYNYYTMGEPTPPAPPIQTDSVAPQPKEKKDKKIDETPVTPPTEKLKKLGISIKLGSKTADRENKCYVTATISNPNNKPVTTTVTLSGNNGFNYVKKTVTIPAKGKVSVGSYFVVTNKIAKGCSVTASESATGQRATKSKFDLKPFHISK